MSTISDRMDVHGYRRVYADIFYHLIARDIQKQKDKKESERKLAQDRKHTRADNRQRLMGFRTSQQGYKAVYEYQRSTKHIRRSHKMRRLWEIHEHQKKTFKKRRNKVIF